MDIENPKILRCIICITKQVNANDLCQGSTIQEGFNKYIKVNEIILMNTHIEFAHLRLVAWRKLDVPHNIIETNDNPQQGKF
jgi:hypothetical protein